MRTDGNTRLAWLAGAVALWGLVVLAKLLSIQIIHHQDYARLAEQQQLHTVDIAAPRGDIIDRNSQTLAMSVEVDTVVVNPLRLSDIAVAAHVVAPILDLDPRKLGQRIQAARDEGQGFLRVKRRISRAESEQLRSLNLDWIEFEKETQRHYPKGIIGAHVLGSVGYLKPEDHQERGNAGLELQLEAVLQGTPGRARFLRDVRKRSIEQYIIQAPKPGASLTLTLDERIQFACERELKAAVEENNCWSGSVVVMDPRTGEILGMSSYPSFDPNKRPAPGEKRLNVAVAAPFEPGSLFKMFTVAAAVESLGVRPESVLACGRITLGGRPVHEAKHFFGPLPVAQVLEKSSNAGAAQLGLRMGNPRMYEYVRRFGFGQETGIDLPAESPGLLRSLERWDRDSAGYIAFGHEIGATALQMARACSAIANGGLLVKPRLVQKRRAPGRPEEVVPIEPAVRILKPETSITMRRMAEGVVLRGTGTGARLGGYTAGGKTGSAQIYDFETGRYTHHYNASFMGFAPVTNPSIVVVVTVNGARVYGGAAAAPAFKKIALEALRVLDVPKDVPLDSEEAPPAREADTRIATSRAPEARPLGPAAPPPPVATGPRVPDFQGMTMRAVVERASRMGLVVLLDGRGVARTQMPAPGTALRRGVPVRVVFAR